MSASPARLLLQWASGEFFRMRRRDARCSPFVQPRVSPIRQSPAHDRQTNGSLDRGSRVHVPLIDVPTPTRMPSCLRVLGSSLSSCALGVVGFAYSAALLSAMGIETKERDLALFVAGALLLPLLCAVVQRFFVHPDFSERDAGSIESINSWAAAVLLYALATLPLLIHVVGKTGDFWPRNAKLVVMTVAALHGAGLCVAAGWLAGLRRPLLLPKPVRSRTVQACALTIGLFVASFMLFWIDPSDRQNLNLFTRLFVAPPFSGSPAPFGLGPALLLAALLIAAVAAMGWLECDLRRRGSARLATIRISMLCAAMILTVACYFDFSLNIDVFHYLSNLGPAVHMLHGGTPMVDAFSLYGPGPILATYAGLTVGPVAFGTAQITVQISNFAFYSLWLVCLYRMSSWKLPALLLGFLTIAVFLALYGGGYQNANNAPSVLGLRYLPPMTMVLVLSCLHAPRRFSTFTALSTGLASVWSFETMVGTLAIHGAFLALLALRDRAPFRLLGDGVKALLPAGAAIILMVICTLLRAGELPDFGVYLRYLSELRGVPWSVVADPMFLGWIAPLLAIFVVFNDAWMRVLGSTARVTGTDSEALFYRFVPMALLLMEQASYFVGRSIEATLDLAIFPFSALAITGALAGVAAVLAEKGAIRLLALIPIAIGLWALTFASLSLLRQNYSTIARPCENSGRCASAPYSFLLHECRDHGRCTPAALAHRLDEMMHKRPILERVGEPAADWGFDTRGVVRDAVSMIETWAASEPTVTVLIGHVLSAAADDEMASDLALMYAGKWHRWPRSSTLSDRIHFGPLLAEQMAAEPVQLREGDLVLVRRSTSEIGRVEAAILERIRAKVTLCQLPHPSKEVIPYRVAGPAGCAS